MSVQPCRLADYKRFLAFLQMFPRYSGMNNQRKQGREKNPPLLLNWADARTC
jgi:hypothetical protein